MKKFWLVIAALAAIAIVVGIIRLNRFNPNSGQTNTISGTDLNRPLIVGIVSWPGYAPGIVANGGFDPNANSIFSKQYGQPVKFVLIEDIDARGKAFAKGGPDGVDVVWSTIDFWANELPNFEKGGIEASAIMQVDWSHGGDALIADNSIKTIEDLKNKKIALVQYTPSQWLLETALRASKLSADDQQTIRDDLIFTQDVQSARAAFVAGQVDAAVVWEPDVSQGLKRPNSHVVLSSADFPNTIADVLVAQNNFIKQHPRAIEALVRGWLDGVAAAKADPQRTARLLMQNEPLFGDLGPDKTKVSLSWVTWPDLQDNVKMFGLDGSVPLFDTIFTNAGKVWQSLKAIDKPVEPAKAKDDSILRKIYSH
jgi:NitT/TauT family transport system substrate-binding protein